jgi:hypothetical protein
VAAPDPRAFVAWLKRRTAGVAVVAFGAFLGLTAANVVGVTSHDATAAGQGETHPAIPAPTLVPGDFFGLPGGTVSGGTTGAGAVAAPARQARLRDGGGTPVLSSGSS